MRPISSGLAQWLLIGLLALGLGGCAGLSGSVGERRAQAEQFPQASPRADTELPPSAGERVTADPPSLDPRQFRLLSTGDEPVLLALQRAPTEPHGLEFDVEIEEYDPWERFNEVTFEINYRLDRYVIKPVARGYNFVVPDRMKQMIVNGFDNIRFVPRLVNSLLQGKLDGAVRELGRFIVNSIFGVAGLFDVAKHEFGIEKSNEDAGQTLGFWGAGPGPYLVLPLLPPLTVRDGIGLGVDMFLDPLGYVLPFFWDRFGMKVGDTINDRALNLELFQGFEETTIDLYSAVRNAYLQRRYRLIQD